MPNDFNQLRRGKITFPGGVLMATSVLRGGVVTKFGMTGNRILAEGVRRVDESGRLRAITDSLDKESGNGSLSVGEL